MMDQKLLPENQNEHIRQLGQNKDPPVKKQTEQSVRSRTGEIMTEPGPGVQENQQQCTCHHK